MTATTPATARADTDATTFPLCESLFLTIEQMSSPSSAVTSGPALTWPVCQPASRVTSVAELNAHLRPIGSSVGSALDGAANAVANVVAAAAQRTSLFICSPRSTQRLSRSENREPAAQTRPTVAHRLAGASM